LIGIFEKVWDIYITPLHKPIIAIYGNNEQLIHETQEQLQRETSYVYIRQYTHTIQNTITAILLIGTYTTQELQERIDNSR
jgi:hypothetical protein